MNWFGSVMNLFTRYNEQVDQSDPDAVVIKQLEAEVQSMRAEYEVLHVTQLRKHISIVRNIQKYSELIAVIRNPKVFKVLGMNQNEIVDEFDGLLEQLEELIRHWDELKGIVALFREITTKKHQEYSEHVIELDSLRTFEYILVEYEVYADIISKKIDGINDMCGTLCMLLEKNK